MVTRRARAALPKWSLATLLSHTTASAARFKRSVRYQSLRDMARLTRSVLITGCNRGIGLELVKQLLKLKEKCPEHIVATCRDRNAAPELMEIADAHTNVHVLELDVTKMDEFPKFVQQLRHIVGEDHGLNLLINNAGILPEEQPLEHLSPDLMRQAFEVNCVAPIFLTQSLLPSLETAAKVSKERGGKSIARSCVIHMSTNMASISDNTSGGRYAYRCSKTALNMAMKSMAVDLDARGILVLAMHPGWVKTDMGGPNGLIDTETCCTNMIQTLSQLGDKDHGVFLRYNNSPLTW